MNFPNPKDLKLGLDKLTEISKKLSIEIEQNLNLRAQLDVAKRQEMERIALNFEILRDIKISQGEQFISKKHFS